MTRNARFYAKVSLFTVLCSLTLIPARAAAQTEHMDWAQELVDHLSPTHNFYGSSPFYIKWAGVNGANQYENRTLCANFLTALIQQAYSLTSTDIRNWTGSTSPTANLYYSTIVNQNGFTRIHNMQDIVPGDVIAIRYDDMLNPTGHVSVVEELPVQRVATAPIVPGTQQYEVWILDSTQRGHGALDSRLKADGTWVSGAGRGIMRFYADSSTGAVVGYTWSLSHHSVYYDSSVRSVAVGRLN
ncbi:MAG TPA: hypothetical protein VLS89_19525 [Candidatus Nanopelagicales bacterium]|nr:hypothetical protein [Candidatus Nanopelagicales bacterium]